MKVRFRLSWGGGIGGLSAFPRLVSSSLTSDTPLGALGGLIEGIWHGLSYDDYFGQLQSDLDLELWRPNFVEYFFR